MAILVSVDHRAWKSARLLNRLAKISASAALAAAGRNRARCQLSIRFAGDAASARLNRQWRSRSGPTNILSFPAPRSAESGFLGDIILASGVIRREAQAQGKSLSDHVAHLIVHGVLHLLGHDHEEKRAARKMERMEVRALAAMGIADPY
ncbi:MAG TPA: rRNA maturation RNase YbeY [Aestuariivirgaceae bacterium]|jgi:probable rRNA maturation factor